MNACTAAQAVIDWSLAIIAASFAAPFVVIAVSIVVLAVIKAIEWVAG